MSFADFLFGWFQPYRRFSGRFWYLCQVDGVAPWYPDHPHPATEVVLRPEEF